MRQLSCRALSYCLIWRVVCLLSFHRGHILVTIYHFSCHMVYLAKLLGWHNMEFLSMCEANPDVTPSKHWNLQVWVHLCLIGICLHTWDHDGIFSNHEELLNQEPSEQYKLWSISVRNMFPYVHAQLFCVQDLHHQHTP